MLWLKYGAQKAKEFISNVQYAVNYWLNSEGFSIGAMDIFIDNKTNVSDSAFNQHTTQRDGTLIANWQEERALKDFQGVGR